MQMGGPRMTLNVRTAGNPAAFAPAIRGQIAALNPEVIPTKVDTLRHVVNERGLSDTRLIPVTFVNRATGPHGFNYADDSEESRQVVRAALAFLQANLGASASSRLPRPTTSCACRHPVLVRRDSWPGGCPG